jgi:hypothetical protein
VIPALIIIFLRRKVPESPRCLAQNGREEEAVEVAERLTGCPVEVTDEDRTFLLEQINALPGPAVPSVAAIQRKAADLCIARKAPPRFDAADPAPRDAAGPDVFAGVPPDDLAEARKMMRSAKIGALALAEWFGWDLAQAQRIASAIRDEQSAPQVAA